MRSILLTHTATFLVVWVTTVLLSGAAGFDGARVVYRK